MGELQVSAIIAKPSATEIYHQGWDERPASGMGPRKIEPWRAFKAMRRLIADKDDTGQVFEIMNALSGSSIRRGYERLLNHPHGGVAAYYRPELADMLQDKAMLAQLPEGSFGRAYLDFVQAQDFSAYGLVSESNKVKDTMIEAAHPHAWYARRLRDIHDMWHVLTGYEADALGEACLVGFSYSQTRSKGFGLIALAAALQFVRARTGYPAAASIMRAFKDGRRSAWLPGLDYASLLATPLDEVRKTYRIPEPVLYRQVPKAIRNQYSGAKDA